MLKTKYFQILAVGLFLVSTAMSLNAEAQKRRGASKAFKGGSFSLGLGVSLLSAEQNGLNNMIKEAKAAQPGVDTNELGSGYEFSGQLGFRFSNNLVAIQLRPAYFMQSTTGSGPDGDYDYKLTGFTIFPLVRLIPLSNDIIDFYIQAGLGYGELKGDITNGATNTKFKGSNFGLQVGLGADFCFVAGHCFGVEGNYRYLPIDRNIVTESNGLPAGTTQAAPNKELENMNGNDIGTSMSGVAGTISYTFSF